MKNYLEIRTKNFEIFFLSIFLIFFPLSESIKQITFWLLLFTFIISKVFDKNFHFDYIAKGLFIYLIANGISIFLSSEPNLAFKWFYSTFMFSVIYIILINEFNSEIEIKILKFSFLLGLLFALFWAIIFWKIAWDRPRLEIHSIGAPNATGTYLGICFLFISWLLAKEIAKNYRKNTKNVIFFLLILLLLLIALILNGSRGMYVGLIAALAYLSLFSSIKEGNYKLFLFFVLFIFGISLGVLFYTELGNRFFDTFSLFDRFTNWEKSFKCFLLNPITGGGTKDCYQDPDNLILTILSRTGIIGLFSFIYLIYSFFRQFGNDKYKIALIIFMLLNGIFETSLKNEPAIALIFSLFMMRNEKNSNI